MPDSPGALLLSLSVGSIISISVSRWSHPLNIGCCVRSTRVLSLKLRLDPFVCTLTLAQFVFCFRYSSFEVFYELALSPAVLWRVLLLKKILIASFLASISERRQLSSAQNQPGWALPLFGRTVEVAFTTAMDAWMTKVDIYSCSWYFSSFLHINSFWSRDLKIFGDWGLEYVGLVQFFFLKISSPLLSNNCDVIPASRR